MIDPNEGLEGTFTLESEKGGIVEEPPFRILVLGDWSGDAEKRPLGDRRPVEIDRDEFDSVMQRLGTKLDLAPGADDPLTLESLDRVLKNGLTGGRMPDQHLRQAIDLMASSCGKDDGLIDGRHVASSSSGKSHSGRSTGNRCLTVL